MKKPYQKDTRFGPKSAPFAGQSPPVKRVKTDGRIGDSRPASSLRAGLDVDNNSKVQPHSGGLASVAASHLGTSPKGGTWSPRAAKARAMAKPNPKPYANPVNLTSKGLKKVKPD